MHSYLRQSAAPENTVPDRRQAGKAQNGFPPDTDTSMPKPAFSVFFWGSGEKIQYFLCRIHNFKRMGIFQFFFGSVPIGNCNAFQSGASCPKYIMLFIPHHDNLVTVFRKSQPLQSFLDHLCLIGSSTLRLQPSRQNKNQYGNIPQRSSQNSLVWKTQWQACILFVSVRITFPECQDTVHSHKSPLVRIVLCKSQLPFLLFLRQFPHIPETAPKGAVPQKCAASEDLVLVFLPSPEHIVRIW